MRYDVILPGPIQPVFNSMKQAFLITLLLASCGVPSPLFSQDAAKDKQKVAALMRLTKIDVNEEARAKLKAAVIRHMKTVTDESEFLTLATRFKIVESNDRLWDIVSKSQSDNNRVVAFGILLELNDIQSISDKVKMEDRPDEMLEAISMTTSLKVIDILKPFLLDRQLSASAKNIAVKGLGRQKIGQEYLLQLAQEKRLPPACDFTAANILLTSSYGEIKSAAKKVMTLPASAGSKPISPIAELVKRKGDAAKGVPIFAKAGTCANCHKVNTEGKEVGPDLTEIGSKLSRRAMFESILNPSAAVSHNYETYIVETIDGLSFSGVLVSETDDKVTLRTAEALTKSILKEDLEGMRKSPNSLMPNDLQKNLSEQDLVDLVEYLMTLKKKQ